MKSAGILAVFAALMLSIGNVMAVPPGKTVEFASSNGKVIFDGKVACGQGPEMRGLPHQVPSCSK